MSQDAGDHVASRYCAKCRQRFEPNFTLRLRAKYCQACVDRALSRSSGHTYTRATRMVESADHVDMTNQEQRDGESQKGDN